MKSILTYAFLATYVVWTLVSCTAFTAPKDPVTGIRQDIPRDEFGNKLWADFDPLNLPGNSFGPYESDPADTWEERSRIFSGHF